MLGKHALPSANSASKPCKCQKQHNRHCSLVLGKCGEADYMIPPFLHIVPLMLVFCFMRSQFLQHCIFKGIHFTSEPSLIYTQQCQNLFLNSRKQQAYVHTAMPQ